MPSPQGGERTVRDGNVVVDAGALARFRRRDTQRHRGRHETMTMTRMRDEGARRRSGWWRWPLWRWTVGGGATAVLAAPAVAMLLDAPGVDWSAGDFVVMGLLLATAAGAVELAMRAPGPPARAAGGLRRGSGRPGDDLGQSDRRAAGPGRRLGQPAVAAGPPGRPGRNGADAAAGQAGGRQRGGGRRRPVGCADPAGIGGFARILN